MSAPIHLAVNGTLMRGLPLNANMLAAGGASVAVEVWAVPPAGLARILEQEPPGLCIGKVTLADGEELLGVLGEPALCEGQREITEHGGWRAYIASRARHEEGSA